MSVSVSVLWLNSTHFFQLVEIGGAQSSEKMESAMHVAARQGHVASKFTPACVHVCVSVCVHSHVCVCVCVCLRAREGESSVFSRNGGPRTKVMSVALALMSCM